ncbi:MAG: hypothetical protein AUJ51_07220 [Elusimicrobia bacterium CG1_02_56_21]|nr:MAG: hypothetical protein AUJ51_07220 [Elusimicrobia bacterium CG1_02_56_21]
MKGISSIFRKVPLPAGFGATALVLASPAAVSIAQLYYIRSVHSYFLYFQPLPGWAAFAAALPLLACEYAATLFIEARRLGPGPRVWLAMAGRMVFLLALSALFFLYPLMVYGQPSIFSPLIGLWNFVLWISWAASPLPAVFLGSAIAAAYWLLTFRRAAFRLTTTVLLPGAATIALFLLLYFYPGGPLREWRGPAAGLEKIFPSDGYRGLNGETWPEGVMFTHDLYADPGDSWAAVSLGATIGRKDAAAPTFVWVNLLRPEFRAFHENTQVRRFSSECPDKLYFAPWHENYILEYVPGADSVKRLPLPASVAGWPVEELFAVHNACGRIYVLNNLNPVLFTLDSDGKLLRTLSLARAGMVETGAVVFQVKRNPRRHTLLISVYGRDPEARPGFKRLMWFTQVLGVHPGRRIFELDEATLELVNSSDPSKGFMDIVLSPDGRRIYAPSVFTRDIYKLDAQNLKITGIMRAPFHVRKLEFSADGKYLYAGSYLGGDVVVYDAASSERLGSFYVTPRVEALGATKKYLYVAGAGGVFRIPNEKILPALLH